MHTDTLAYQVLTDRSVIQILVAAWPQDIADAVVERLKQEADRYWGINANRSLELADAIIDIGRARDNVAHIALGTMARGDALKLLGYVNEAWEALEAAGNLFASIGDQVGWARTRIGRVGICVDLNRIAEALPDTERAWAIFTEHKEFEKRLRLDNDTAYIYIQLGDHQHALTLYRSALTTATALDATGEKYLGTLYTNLGFVYDALGDLGQALTYHEQALKFFERTNEVRNIAVAETNIAIIAMTQGKYRRALQLLHRASHLYASEELPRDANDVNRLIADCYILLNRHLEARDLLQQVIGAYHAVGSSYEEALAYVQLATAEAELGNFEAAQAALDAAQPIFAALGSASWEATTRLRRGRIALQQGQFDAAEQEAIAAAQCFEAIGQQVLYAQATLLRGQAALAQTKLAVAAHAGTTTLQVAQRCNVPGLRYTTHLLLGRVAEAHNDTLRAIRRYRAAAATVERMQRGLTIRLRPGFLEDKGEALRALIALHLRDGQTERALGALERAKSQVLLGHLDNRDQLRWTADDSHSEALIEELTHLRQKHHRLYQATHGTIPKDGVSSAETLETLHEITTCERRMRAITEQLYLRGGSMTDPTAIPSQQELQQELDDAALVEYYNDGTQLWAFVLDRRSLTQHRLQATVPQIDQLLAQLQINIAAALRLDSHGPSTRALTLLAQRILGRLHDLLIAPLASRLHGHTRLLVVPYGALHYLPFHLLHTGTTYLIEQHELVILPAAGLLPQRGPRREPGALVLAHSSDGQLPQTLVEAEVVHQLMGGHMLCEGSVCRPVLETPPRQVLHIAVHGEQRLDQPDLSYLHLADGQLYADDLWQHDLSYELVTLSACETGRARVAAGDELIGLGQGLLYAGAGAVISSLWRVRDDSVVQLMEHLYSALRSGVSKAAALRGAQQAVLTAEPRLHPALWGAFQLVGDARPLSA
jgi:CHAT domain-containing protein